MSESDSPRRVVAEIRVGADQPAITKIGSRSLHHYWQALVRDFQGVLLAPQRRPDDGGVSWTWREPARSKPVAPPELAELRERLTAANRSFAKNLDGSELGAEGLGGLNPEEGIDQLKSTVNELVAKLTGKPDSKLAAFACRTDAGIKLHSWGASVPAQPFFPDAHDCEVSGTVLVGEKGASDLEVVIESRTGVCLARTRSDASGGFCLQKIGPGTHRVRVISDRVDFPVSGVIVTVERTSIANLELRSTSVTVASGRASPTDSPDSRERSPAPRAKAEEPAATVSRAEPGRRWLWGTVITTAVLAVAGGGWWTWNLWHADDRRPDAPTGESSFSGGRSGEKGGGGERLRSSRLADLGRRSSSPASAIPDLPSTSVRDHQGSRLPSTSASSAAEPLQSNSAGAKESGSIAGRAANDPPAGRKRPEMVDKPDTATKATSVASNALEDAPWSADMADAPDQKDPEVAVDSTKSLPTRKSLKLSEAAPATPPVAPSKAGAETSSAQVAVGGGLPDSERTSNRRGAARSAMTGAKSGKISPEIGTLAAGSSPAAADEAEDLPGSNGSGDAPRAAASTKSDSAPPTAGTGGNAPSVASPPTAPGSPMAADESTDQTSASDPRAAALGAVAATAAGQSVAKAHRASPSTSGPTHSASQAGSLEKDMAFTGSTPLPGQQSEKARATPEANRADHAPPVAAATPVDTSTAGAAEAVEPSPVQSRPKALPRTASAAKTPAARAPHREENRLEPAVESAAGESSSIAAGPTLGVSPGAGGQPAKGEQLVRQVCVRVSSWRPQLVEDVILPTQPVRVGEDDAIERLREQYLLERQGQIPASFREPVLWNGCAVEVSSADLTAAGPLRWRGASGPRTGSATVSGARAEVAWSGGTPPANGRYVLCRSDGREIASIAVDQGTVVIRAADQVRCWFWVAVEPAAADSVAPTGSQAVARFDWQLLPGAIFPGLSRRSDHWRNGRTQRLDLPVDFRVAARMGICLVDRISGWAIGSNIEQAPVSPPAR